MVLMLALSVERYILISRGLTAHLILTKKRRNILYSVSLGTCVVLPSLYIVDYVANVPFADNFDQMAYMYETVSMKVRLHRPQLRYRQHVGLS